MKLRSHHWHSMVNPMKSNWVLPFQTHVQIVYNLSMQRCLLYAWGRSWTDKTVYDEIDIHDFIEWNRFVSSLCIFLRHFYRHGKHNEIEIIFMVDIIVHTKNMPISMDFCSITLCACARELICFLKRTLSLAQRNVSGRRQKVSIYTSWRCELDNEFLGNIALIYWK